MVTPLTVKSNGTLAITAWSALATDELAITSPATPNINHIPLLSSFLIRSRFLQNAGLTNVDGPALTEVLRAHERT